MKAIIFPQLIWGDPSHPWVKPGQLYTRGPGFYKIPSFNDVPKDFRIYLSDTNNKFCVHSSKAVGEPPLFLGGASYFAIQHAINCFRSASGGDEKKEFYTTDHPATSERIRMGCPDEIAVSITSNSKNFHAKGSW